MYMFDCLISNYQILEMLTTIFMTTNYNDDAVTHNVIMRLLAVPLLPKEYIVDAFQNERRKIVGIEPVEQLFNYVSMVIFGNRRTGLCTDSLFKQTMTVMVSFLSIRLYTYQLLNPFSEIG